MSDLPHPDLKPVMPRLSTGRAVIALILREMSTTYGRSPGGYLWAILEPALGITLLVLVFSLAFSAPPLGTNFALFYASGILPFLMFNDVVNKVASAIPFSRQLLEYPRVTFVDALLARLILNAITHLMAHVCILTFILNVFSISTSINYIDICLAYLLVIFIALGVGALNGILILSYPMWQTIWSIVTRPLLLVSCIIFLFESVPQQYADFLWYNPLVHIIGLMREGYYPYYHPTYVSVIFVVMFASTCCATGLFFLRRYHQDMLIK
ncbi:MAG: ABC transporter permease [Sulfitobacter sp.]